MNIKIAVVIPCFKCRNKILQVLNKIGTEVCRIYLIDDACPENTGEFALKNFHDKRLDVIFHNENLGVGGAVKTGYSHAIKEEMDIVVKIDGDNQMDPSLIPFFIMPLIDGSADYTKGNRFFSLESIKGMPRVRIFGNAALSFISKISTGYWSLFDPTNGYTAINVSTLKLLPLYKISQNYFFETDMLFRLNLIGAVVKDIQMFSKYEDEKSNLKIFHTLHDFSIKNLKIFSKRILYKYFLLNFNIASIELVCGLLFLLFSISFGSYHWFEASITQKATPTGTIFLAAIPLILGFQLCLSFLHNDIFTEPTQAISVKKKFTYDFSQKNINLNSNT
jgi:dolichol-phosphate mannosyltransferase